MNQFHCQGITSLNPGSQTEAKGPFVVDESLLCYLKAINRLDAS